MTSKHILIIFIFNLLLINNLEAQNGLKKSKSTLFFSYDFLLNNLNIKPNLNDGVSIANVSLPNAFTFQRSTKNLSIGMMKPLNNRLTLILGIGFATRNELIKYQKEELNSTISNLSTANGQLNFNIVKKINEVEDNNKIRLLTSVVGAKYTIPNVKSDLKPYIFANLKPSIRFNTVGFELGTEVGAGFNISFLNNLLNFEPLVGFQMLSKHNSASELFTITPTTYWGLRTKLNASRY